MPTGPGASVVAVLLHLGHRGNHDRRNEEEMAYSIGLYRFGKEF